MSRRFLVAIAAAVGFLLAAPTVSLAGTPHDTTSTIWKGTEMTSVAIKTGYAPVNHIKLYYEIHGTGAPLILLHGGLGVISMFGEVLPLLAKNRQVIAVDLQAHGRTADIDRPIRYELLADDMAALIKHPHAAG